MTAQPVALARQGRLAILTLDNPPVGALATVMVDRLREAVAGLDGEETAALVIRSAVPAYFGAGANLKELEGADPDRFVAYVEAVRGAVEAVAAAPFLTVAAIDGRALGGGFELALACDLRFASRDATFGLPEIKLGLLPGAGGTQRLTRMAGAARASELMLSGRQIDAEEAARMGLVDLADGPPAGERAIAWSARYCEMPPLAAAAIRRCVEAAASPNFDAGMEAELAEIAALYRDGDARERIAAFLAR